MRLATRSVMRPGSGQTAQGSANAVKGLARTLEPISGPILVPARRVSKKSPFFGSNATRRAQANAGDNANCRIQAEPRARRKGLSFGGHWLSRSCAAGGPAGVGRRPAAKLKCPPARSGASASLEAPLGLRHSPHARNGSYRPIRTRCARAGAPRTLFLPRTTRPRGDPHALRVSYDTPRSESPERSVVTRPRGLRRNDETAMGSVSSARRRRWLSARPRWGSLTL